MPKRSEVYFATMRTKPGQDLPWKIGKLFHQAGLGEVVEEGDFVAIKLHFGERGSTAFIRPILVRPVVNQVRQNSGMPFLTDTNTLYRGQRSNSCQHVSLAMEHGFVPSVVDAPVLIADGISGKSFQRVAIQGRHFGEAFIASDIYHADTIIGLAHVKLHLATGLGGAIKNLAMGGASLAGKLAQHSNVRPWIKRELCTGCQRCLRVCPVGAIEMDRRRAQIDPMICTGCAECIATCSEGAVKIKWDAASHDLQERMVEYLLAIVQSKGGKIGYINFLMDITPDCDCFPNSDAPIVPNIGLLASKDPVAIDQASADLIIRSRGLENSSLGRVQEPGDDKIRAIYPEIDWGIQLRYGEEVGLGTRDYDLVKIDES